MKSKIEKLQNLYTENLVRWSYKHTLEFIDIKMLRISFEF